MTKKRLSNYRIGEAVYSDYWDVYNLYKQLTNGEPMFTEPEYRKYIDDKSRHISLVKDSKGKAIGLIAWIIWLGALSFPLDICFIQDMIVDDKHRRKGLGSFMLNHTKQWAKDNNIYIVHLQTDNQEAIDFYTKNEFEVRNKGLFCFLRDSQGKV